MRKYRQLAERILPQGRILAELNKLSRSRMNGAKEDYATVTRAWTNTAVKYRLETGRSIAGQLFRHWGIPPTCDVK